MNRIFSQQGQQGQQSQGKKMQKARGPSTANPMAPQQPSPNSRDEQFLWVSFTRQKEGCLLIFHD